MKIQWMATALLGAALAVGCGDRKAEDTQNQAQNEGTTVSVPPDTSVQANAQPPAQPPAAASPSRDGSAARADSSGGRSTSGARAATKPAPAPARTTETARPAERIDREETRAAAGSAPRAVPTVRTVTIPVGTALPLELTTALSSETAQVEQPVTARLRRAVTVNGETVLPAGAVFHGEVSDVDRAGRVQGRARLGLRFTSVVVGGRREDLRTNPVTFEGEATKGEDATKIGAGAGIGAAIGGILGGGKGAAKGGAIGAAAGTGAVLATRGKEVELAAGKEIDTTLATPVEVEVR